MIFLDGEGPAFDAIARVDWDRTPVGGPERWPADLRANLAGILRATAPKVLLWGSELVTFCNNACIEEGCVDASGIGARYPEFDPDRWASVMTCVRKGLDGRGSVIPEFQAPHAKEPDGIVYQLSFSPVFDDRLTVSGVLVDIFDLTARHRQEQDLRSEVGLLNQLFSSAPVLIVYCTGAEPTIDYANHAFQDLFEGRVLVGRKAAEAVPEAAEHGYIDRMKAVYATGVPWSAREVPLRIRTADHAQGMVHYFDFASHPIRTPEGAISGLLLSGYEVTDRHAAHEESERLRHQLLHSSRMEAMGTMAATIAHELTQPLAAASNYLAAAKFAVQADDLDVRTRAPPPLAEAQTQLIRAGAIIRRMRSLVERGRVTAKPFDLVQSAERAIDLLHAGGEFDDFRIEVEARPGSRLAIGDDIQIEQVFVNILRNAAYASQDGDKAKAKICLERQGAMIEVLVRDWGPGIPPDLLERLFTPMPHPTSSGLGVGLSLCRTIIEAHGGSIDAYNVDHQGAVFRFTLPAADAPV